MVTKDVSNGYKIIQTIVEAILSSITRPESYKDLNATWNESEFLVDWLITKSKISDLLSKYSLDSNYLPTLKATRSKQNASILKRSDDFYKKLGLPTDNNIFGLNGKTPEVYKRPVENLTTTERNILRLLIENSDRVVTFDEIGDNMFVNDRMDMEARAPHQIKIQVDGKPLVDLDVDFHHLGPYVVFPVPAQVTAAK